MEKGHYGHYSGNARHSRVTSHNMAATKRDDEPHMQYLKEDVKYDNKHGHSDIDMTCLLYTSPSPRDSDSSRMPSSA